MHVDFPPPLGPTSATTCARDRGRSSEIARGPPSRAISGAADLARGGVRRELVEHEMVRPEGVTESDRVEPHVADARRRREARRCARRVRRILRRILAVIRPVGRRAHDPVDDVVARADRLPYSPWCCCWWCKRHRHRRCYRYRYRGCRCFTCATAVNTEASAPKYPESDCK